MFCGLITSRKDSIIPREPGAEYKRDDPANQIVIIAGTLIIAKKINTTSPNVTKAKAIIGVM
jgi:hypothetical protein